MRQRPRPSERRAPWGAASEQRLRASTSESWADKIDAAILAACHSAQRGAVIDPAARVSILTARGCGKTTAIAARLVRKSARRKRAVCLYFAPTRLRAKELIWDALKELCQKLQIKARFLETTLTCVFVKTRSKIMLAGAESMKDVDVYRGQSFDEVAVDECSLIKDEILRAIVQRIIGPRLGDKNGCIVFAGTPGTFRRGYWYDLTRPGGDLHRPYAQRDDEEFAGWIGWSSHWWSMRSAAQEVPAIARLWADAQVTKAREKWTDKNPIWLREYEGVWAEDNTDAIYSAYDAERNAWKPQMIRRGSVLIAQLPDDVTALGEVLYAYGGDLGHSDPFALNVFAWAPRDPHRRIYHVFCFEKRRLYARAIAQLLLGEDEDSPKKVRDAERPLGLIGATGWPAVTAADTAGAGNMVLDELRVVYGVPLEPAKKSEKYSCFDVVNGAFTDQRLFIMSESALEGEISALQWSQNASGLLVEPTGVPNHSSDSMVYVVPRAVTMFEDVLPPSTKQERGGAVPPPVVPPPAMTAPLAAAAAPVVALKIDDDFCFEDDEAHADMAIDG